MTKVIKEVSGKLGLFKIEDDLFTYDTQLGMIFNKFNKLSGINEDLFTYEIEIPKPVFTPRVEQQTGFKTYDEFKDEWMKEWNKGIPWVPEEPWSKSRIPIDNIHHICEPFCFKNGKAKWPTCNSNDDGLCNGGELSGMIRRSWGDAIQGVMNFRAWLKRCFRDIHELDYELLVKLEECWRNMNDNEYSQFTNYRNDIRGLYTNANLQATYDPYLDINRIFGRDDRTRNDGDIQDIKEPINNHDMKGFESNMERNDTPYYFDKEKEQHNEERCELFDDPAQEPPICKIEMFEMIKYTFKPAENYVAIKECKYDDLTRTEDDSCHA
ncbi:hypothetical protein Tco_0987636 [Tanacetum coccineum]